MNYKLLLLIFYLIITLTSERILKEENEENKKDEDDLKSCEEEDETESSSEQKIDPSKISQNKIRKENMPHSQVLLPIRRVGTSNMQMGEGPCGGISKMPANTLTTKGSSINVIWEVLVPENSGNCTVKISNGQQDLDSFKLLKPVDTEMNGDGSFKCGRDKGFEHKEFILPENYECDGCTLQWKWSTSYGDIYSCSDIIINGGSLSKCMGRCLNGGSCFNGQCLCTKGYSGEFCEDEGGSISWTWLWILLGLICAGGLGYLGYKYVYPLCDKKSTQGWLKGPGDSIHNPLPENSSQRQEPEFE